MSHTILFIPNDCIQIYILNTSENIILNYRIFLSEFVNQFLDLCTLGTFFRTTTGSTMLRKTTRTLNKMKVIVVRPVYDIRLTDQIQRANQLHSLKVCTVKLRHHRLYLCTVKHSHQDRFNNIVIMMP